MRTILTLLACFILTACTTYTVHRKPDGTVDVSIVSTRSFEQPVLHYAREGNDPTVFDFKAANADNNTAAIVTLFAPIIEGIASGAILVRPPQK